MILKLSNNQSSSSERTAKVSMLNLVAMIVGLSISTTVMAGSNSFTTSAHLPTNAKATCVANVSSWFPGNRVTQNGWVKPANSLAPIFANFKDNTKCDFYKWGAQMFLWLTSGVNTQHVFNSSPVFYNVSVEENKKRTFLSGNGPMLLTVRKGKTDSEIELGQAGGGDVLLSQKNSLVYYGLHANDVFALFTTCQNQPNCKLSKNFPSTPAQMSAVASYATSYGYPLWDVQAMAIELKTSWIDASTLSSKDRSNYVLSQAIVPVFDRSKAKGPWTITGNTEKTLALVGMHVVGSVNGHPEMVWSTFEHVNNVPDNTYTYTTTSNTMGTQAYNSSGNWNFIKSNAAAPKSITANAKVSTNSGSSLPQSIVNVNGANISPINILRVDSWGNLHGDPSSTANNTDLVSINVSVLSQLKAGDIRGNYIQTGGIWTAEGQIPPGYPTTDPAYLRGSLNLANTTMETFYQFHNKSPGAFNPRNCFGCHGSTTSDATGISHIFNALQPLPRK